MVKAEWYVDWFNSPYYHLLYDKRNEEEANLFINNLCSKIQLKDNAFIWDLACGRGRHSLALGRKGFQVIGTDLSENNIHEAMTNSTAKLDFFVHDMRTPFKLNYFDVVFNLFTSIGYFKNFNDNYLVFKNVANSLKENGLFVVDFFNVDKIQETIKPSYVEQRGEVTFHIKKTIAQKAILKRIEFNKDGKDYYFEESVSLLKKSDFEEFAGRAGLTICDIFGNYQLQNFDVLHSERLILFFKKQEK